MENIKEHLKLEQKEFLRHCLLSKYKGSGNGGQKRNKVESGIRLQWKEDDKLEVTCCEERSPELNLKKAIAKMKLYLAYQVRDDINLSNPLSFPSNNHKVSTSNPLYAFFVKEFLDAFLASEGQLKKVAELFGLSSSAMGKVIFQDKKLLEKVQQIRQQFELSPLRQ